MPIGLGDLFGQAIPLDTSQLPSWLNEVLQIMLLQNPDYARIARTAITNLMSAPQTLMAASQYPTIPAAGQAVQQAGTGQTTTLPQPIMSPVGGPSFASPAGQPATSPPPSVIHQVWGTMVDNGRAPAGTPAGTPASTQPASSPAPTASPSPQATQPYQTGGDMGGGGGSATGGGAGGGGAQAGAGNPGNQGNIGGGGGGLVGENIGGGDYGSTWT